jgi:FAD/FMN-containing dehydrogenase
VSGIDALQASISGAVLEPATPAYDTALDIDNGRVDLRPACVVQPRSQHDIKLTLQHARDHGLPLTVKGGGHSAAGYCLNHGGIVLDMSLLNDMDLNPQTQTLRVQLGARWAQVYHLLQHSGTGLIPVGGGCLTVGLGGFLLGGGYSFTSRSYGMGCDNLRSVDLVTPDGTLHHLHDGADNPLDEDLWWACRGGGGGNFGDAVAAELRVHKPHVSTMLVGEITYPLAAGQDVIGAYNEWAPKLPAAMAAYGYLGYQPDPVEPNRRISVFRITAVYNGAHYDGIDLLRRMLRLPAIRVELYDMALPLWEDKIGKSTLVGDRQAYIRSGFLPEGGMTADVIDIYQRFIDDSPSPDSFVVWTHGGGAISAVAPEATAFVHREPGYIYELKSIWTDPAGARRNIEWAYEFGEALAPHFRGAYANYIDPLLADWPQQYYGRNYARLERIKKVVDPHGLFGFQQGIGSPFRPGTTEPLDLSPLDRTQFPGKNPPRGGATPPSLDGFLKLSVTLTGFEQHVLLGTGMLQTYYDELLRIIGADEAGALLAAFNAVPKDDDTQLQKVVLCSPRYGPVARNVVKMWYLGTWTQLPRQWHAAYGATSDDTDHVVSAAAYSEGLVWPAAGTHPMSAKQPGFGTWAEPSAVQLPTAPEAQS